MTISDNNEFNIKSTNAGAGCNTFGFNIEADEISFTVTNRNIRVEEAYVIDHRNITAENFDDVSVTEKATQLLTGNDATDKAYYWVPLEDAEVIATGTAPNQTYSLTKGVHGKIFINVGGNKCVYISHTVVKANSVELDSKLNGGFEVTDKMTYNLGAIIEAIQELNRRTMFMDIDMSFNGAMSYGDYVSGNVKSGAYGKVLDGLPGATDVNTGKHYA